MIAETTIAAGYKTIDALRHAINKRLSADNIKLPMMPQVASKIMALTNDPNTDISDLSNLIHRDPSLAARVLKVSNSAAFGGGQEITSLEEATNRLGINTLSEITLSASLQAGIFRAPGFEKEVNQLWQHALASAYFGKEIARVRRDSSDVMFLCGLLHAIGKPAVLQILADLRQQHDFLLKPEMLITLLDELHSGISVRMAKQWELPQVVQTTCAHYRDYTAAITNQKETAMIYLADNMATWLVDNNSLDEEALRQNPVFESLQFDPEAIQSVLDLKPTVQSQIAAMEH